MNRTGMVIIVGLIVCTLVFFWLNSDPFSDWATINPPTTEGTFTLPKPVETPERPGHKVYQVKNEKIDIQVGVYPKSFLQLPENTSEPDKLEHFEQSILGLIQENLAAKGVKPVLQFEGDLTTERAIGQQVRIQAGNQFVLTRFYVAPDALYCFKVDNMDEKTNPIVDQIFKSIKP